MLIVVECFDAMSRNLPDSLLGSMTVALGNHDVIDEFSVAMRDLDQHDQRHLAEIVAPNVLRRQLTNEHGARTPVTDRQEYLMFTVSFLQLAARARTMSPPEDTNFNDVGSKVRALRAAADALEYAGASSTHVGGDLAAAVTASLDEPEPDPAPLTEAPAASVSRMEKRKRNPH